MQAPEIGDIFAQVLHRLALFGDTTIVPKKLRNLASHCGGVPPTAHLAPFKDTPWVADPGNGVYGKIVRKLMRIQNAEAAAGVERAHVSNISPCNDESLGDLVEASLAAANAASCIQKAVPHTWPTLIGGAHAHGDLVTRWLVDTVHWNVMQ